MKRAWFVRRLYRTVKEWIMENSRPIPPVASSLAEMAKGGIGALRMAVERAAPVHGTVLGTVPQEEEIIAQGGSVSASAGEKVNSKQTSLFQRGDTVVDMVKNRRGTIIRVIDASDGIKLELVNSRGKSWKQYESKVMMYSG